jgi:hypothetical protein
MFWVMKLWGREVSNESAAPILRLIHFFSEDGSSELIASFGNHAENFTA